MRIPLSTPATIWLTSPPSPVPPGHVSGILKAFADTPKVYRYTGPHRFYRAAGRTAKGDLASPYGGWWADEKVLIGIAANLEKFEGWLTAGEINAAWPAQYRALTALCTDWNDMSETFCLDLPAGEQVEAMAGVTREQPRESTLDPSLSTSPMLRGGAEQVFMKVKNPLWVSKKSIF